MFKGSATSGIVADHTLIEFSFRCIYNVSVKSRQSITTILCYHVSELF